MKKKLLLCVGVLALAINGLALIEIDTTPVTTNDSARTVFANRLRHVWRNITDTEYVHSEESVIDELNGIYRFDCSGFICEILMKDALPDHYDDIYDYWQNNRDSMVNADGDHYNSIRPLAGQLYDYFFDQILQSDDTMSASNDYWYVFQDVNEMQRGDLILARYDDQWKINYTNRTTGTGHLMVAWEVLAMDSSSNLTVRVFDAALSAHTSAEDTRAQNNTPLTTDGSGIGSGLMEFRISGDGKNRPLGYYWSTISTRLYSIYDGSTADQYNRLEGIILARPIFTPYTVKPDPAIEEIAVVDQGDGHSVVIIDLDTNLVSSVYHVEYTDSLTPVWHDTGVDAQGSSFNVVVSNSVPKRFFRLIRE